MCGARRATSAASSTVSTSPSGVVEETRWPALSLSKGLDRDRAVDETGHQMAVFGRLGSRPFTLEEMQERYLDGAGDPWYVTDQVRLEDRVERSQ